MFRQVRFWRMVVLFTAFSLWAPALSAGERVVVHMGNGDQIEGELLRRADGMVWLTVGGEVVSLSARRIKRIEGKTKGSGRTDLKKHGLYSTAKLPLRDMQSLVNEIGPAIVLVKTPSGLGTGWFCHPGGYVITNHHVVAGERTIRITMFPKEGKTLGRKVFRKVRIVALNAEMDLALLKIEEKLGVKVPQLVLGDSQKVKVGDKVFAIGNPLGLERSTSQGIISKVARNIGGRLFIQTTAPIAPGNSGGPLFNLRGEVLGVVSRGAIIFDGLGFAIPSDYVKEFLDHVESFAYDEDNPNTGVQYMEVPVSSTKGGLRFGKSDFIKVGHGLADLVLGDLNGDGVDEILFANNNKAEIGILWHRPRQAKRERRADDQDVNDLPRSERFVLETLPVASRVGALAVGDIDGDGRRDLVFHGDIDGLAVMSQQKDGKFAPPEKIDDLSVSGLPGAIRVVDLNADKRPDLFVLGQDRFSVYLAGQQRQDHPLNPALLSKVKSFELLDHDGDGNLDVLFFTQHGRFGAYLRLQGADGQFAEEVPLEVPISGPVRATHSGKKKAFVALDVGKNRVRKLRLRSDQSHRGWLSLPVGLSGKQELVVDMSNTDGKVGMEILSVDEQDHEYVLLKRHRGGFKATRSPAPEAVTTAKLHRDANGRQVVFTFSRKEQLFGASRLEKGQISFPRPIHTTGPVQLMQLERLKGLDGKSAEQAVLLWVEKRGTGYSVQMANADQAVAAMGRRDKGSIELSSKTLTFERSGKLEQGLPKRPVRLAFADFDGDRHLDLILFWAYSGKESLFLGKGQGRYVELLSEQGIVSREGDKAGLLVADLDGDGHTDVLQVKPGFVRVLKVDKAGKLYVAAQHNWRHGQLKHFDRMPGKKDRGRFMAVDGKQAYVVRLSPRGGRFLVEERMDLSGLDLSSILVGDVDGDGAADLVGVGTGNLLVRVNGGTRPRMVAELLLNANLSHHSFFKLHSADLDGDHSDELLLFDARRAILEILKAGRGGKLKTIFRHPLYDKHLSKRARMGGKKGGQQPRAVATGDVDGNGKVDMIFLMQDRVAIYLQDK